MSDRAEKYIAIAKEGTKENIDFLVSQLHENIDLPTTKVIDYSLGFVENEEGRNRLKHYLFKGTQMQRNYCTLYFARRNEWKVVNRAYELKLIDYKQAYSR